MFATSSVAMVASFVSSLTHGLLTQCSGTLIESVGGTIRATASTLGLGVTSLGFPTLGAAVSTAGVVASTLLSGTMRVPIPGLVALSSSATGGLVCIAVGALGRALSLGVKLSSRALMRYKGRQRGFGRQTEGVSGGLDTLGLIIEQGNLKEQGGEGERKGGILAVCAHSAPLFSGPSCSTLCNILGSERQEDCQWVSIADSWARGVGGVDEPEPPTKVSLSPHPLEGGKWVLVPFPPSPLQAPAKK